MLINRWLDKQLMVYLSKKILLSNRKEHIIDTYKTVNESPQIMPCIKNQTKKTIYYMIPFI